MLDTTVVILAAGIGSRLAPLTDAVPKCLVPVAGIPILHHQISAFRAAGISQIVIVAGYRAAQVKASAPEGCLVVENSEYLDTNNMYSLALAEQHVRGDMVLVNGDVVFAANIITDLLRCTHDDCIATDVGNYLDESMKVSVQEDGTIQRIAKTISREDAYGTSIDLYRFSSTTAAKLFRLISQYLRTDRRQWTEVAIDQLLKEVPVRPFDIAGRDWVEIDNQNDLREAEAKWSRTLS